MPDFVTRDSGAREEFDSGMVRDTAAGKVRWHLVADGPMLGRWAGLLTRGADKYQDDEARAKGEPNNWLKARGQGEYQRFRESAFRHFMDWFYGKEDEDHGAAVFFNINGAEFVREVMEGGQAETTLSEGPGPDVVTSATEEGQGGSDGAAASREEEASMASVRDSSADPGDHLQRGSMGDALGLIYHGEYGSIVIREPDDSRLDIASYASDPD